MNTGMRAVVEPDFEIQSLNRSNFLAVWSPPGIQPKTLVKHVIDMAGGRVQKNTLRQWAARAFGAIWKRASAGRMHFRAPQRCSHSASTNSTRSLLRSEPRMSFRGGILQIGCNLRRYALGHLQPVAWLLRPLCEKGFVFLYGDDSS